MHEMKNVEKEITQSPIARKKKRKENVDNYAWWIGDDQYRRTRTLKYPQWIHQFHWRHFLPTTIFLANLSFLEKMD